MKIRSLYKIFLTAFFSIAVMISCEYDDLNQDPTRPGGDNVPLVAASIGMFSEPMDNPLWHFIAFSAGTGGSMLIIGSAAGVVAMGMEKIDFFWYFKNISWLAFLGFISGSLTFMLLRGFIM